jgi:hypothetical protein
VTGSGGPGWVHTASNDNHNNNKCKGTYYYYCYYSQSVPQLIRWFSSGSWSLFLSGRTSAEEGKGSKLHCPFWVRALR